MPSSSELDLSALADFVQQKMEGAPRRAPASPQPVDAAELSDVDRELLALEAEFERETGQSIDALLDDDAQRLRDEIEARIQGGFVGDGQEARSEAELLAELSEPQRQRLLALPPEDRAFLLQADVATKGAYERLPGAERAVLVRLPTDQRTAFLAMPSTERAFVAALASEAQRHYLRLNPDSREHFRKATPEQREVILEDAKHLRASLTSKPPEEAARTLAARLFDDLGLVAAWYPELLQRASAIAFNHLREAPGDEAGAELRTLKLLLEEPDVVEPLLDELEQFFEGNGEDEELSLSGAAGLSPLFVVEHFVRIRQELYALIRRLAQPGLTRNNLSEALRRCVIVTASVAVAKGR